MKGNSKFLGILLALLAIGMVISAANAADLVQKDFNGKFAVDVPSECDFNEGAVTNINAGDVSMCLEVFENLANNSDDVSTVIYLNDSSADKRVISDFISGLEKDGKKVEETDKYFVVETKNSADVNIDVADDLDSFLSFVGDIFSSDADMSFSADGNQISLSEKGLFISDANGENVSISSDGVVVSGSDSEDGSSDVSVNVDENMTGDVKTGDYAAYLKNQKGDQLIVISGDNLDLLKAMAETATFSEN